MQKLAGVKSVQEGHEAELAFAGPPRQKAMISLVERHVLPRLLLAQPGLVLRDGFGDGLSDRIPALIDTRCSPMMRGSRSCCTACIGAG
jgi:hypothetical protein